MIPFSTAAWQRERPEVHVRPAWALIVAAACASSGQALTLTEGGSRLVIRDAVNQAQLLRLGSEPGPGDPVAVDTASRRQTIEAAAPSTDLIDSSGLAEVEVSQGDHWVPEGTAIPPTLDLHPRSATVSKPPGSMRCGDTFDIQSGQTFKYLKGRHTGIKRIRKNEECWISKDNWLPHQPGTFDGSGTLTGVMDETRAPTTWMQFAVATTITLVVSLALLAVYNNAAESIERRTGVTLTHMCCLAFMVLSLSIDISMKTAAKAGGHGRYNFDPAVAVLVIELSKLVISSGLVACSEMPRMLKGESVATPSLKDCCWLAVPGLVYTATNIIAYQAIQNIPLATFSVLRETRLFWNAFLWVILFQSSLSQTRWMGVIGIFVGCTVSQIPAMMKAEFPPEIMWVLILAFLTAAGGVMTEYAYKQRAAIDINLQGCVIYIASSFFTLCFILVHRRHLLASAAVFFQGFEPECMQIVVLQVLQGLTVSRILKHVESVTKSIVSSLCSPLLTFIGSAALGYKLHAHEIMAASVVLVSCLLYLKDGPLAGKPKDLDAACLKLVGHVRSGRRLTV